MIKCRVLIAQAEPRGRWPTQSTHSFIHFFSFLLFFLDNNGWDLQSNFLLKSDPYLVDMWPFYLISYSKIQCKWNVCTHWNIRSKKHGCKESQWWQTWFGMIKLFSSFSNGINLLLHPSNEQSLELFMIQGIMLVLWKKCPHAVSQFGKLSSSLQMT